MALDPEKRLDRVTIRGFRSIRALEDFELTDLNVLVGANGSGKSNLISFFRLFRALVTGGLDRYLRDSGGLDDLLFGGPRVTPRMHLAARFGGGALRFTLQPSNAGLCSLTDESPYPLPAAGDRRQPGVRTDGVSDLVREGDGSPWEVGDSQPVRNTVESWGAYHFHDTSRLSGMRRYQIVEDDARLRSDGSNLAPFLRRLKSTEPAVYRDILDSCRLVVPFLEDFRFREEEFGPSRKVRLSWKARGSDHPMQAYHLSDGSLRFLCLATALLQPDPPSAIVVDEPELGLPPLAISLLAELIQHGSRRTQVVVATQCPHLLDEFSVEEVIVVRRQKGESRFERLDERDYRAWLDEYTVGELWRKNVIDGGPIHDADGRSPRAAETTGRGLGAEVAC